MTRTLINLAAGTALALAPAGVLAAQDSAPEVAGDEIVVEGYTEKEVRDFLWRSLESDGQMISRRSEPICLGIDNAPAALADPIRARIEANLAEFKVPKGEPGCKANTIVIFYRDAHGFVNWLSKKDGGIAFAALYKPQMQRLIKPMRQVYAWHYQPDKVIRRENAKTNVAGLQPGEVPVAPVGFGIGGRILPQLAPVNATHSFAVVDTDAIGGLTIEQVADYLTMRILVEFRADAGGKVPSGSILGLFSDTGSNPDAPEGLTRLDKALLSQIYVEGGNFRTGSVRAAVARGAVSDLKEDGLITEAADQP